MMEKILEDILIVKGISIQEFVNKLGVTRQAVSVYLKTKKFNIKTLNNNKNIATLLYKRVAIKKPKPILCNI
jgi:predicted transcriptional regulator